MHLSCQDEDPSCSSATQTRCHGFLKLTSKAILAGFFFELHRDNNHVFVMCLPVTAHVKHASL